MKSRVIQDEPERPDRVAAGQPSPEPPQPGRIPTRAVLIVVLAVAVLLAVFAVVFALR
jgi:hypothetical protein